jgi:hypothetical protein
MPEPGLDREKLVKLLGLTTSAQAGKRLVALDKAVALTPEAKVGWRELILVPLHELGIATGDRDRLNAVLVQGWRLNGWEQQFCACLHCQRRPLTVRQSVCLQRIAERLGIE